MSKIYLKGIAQKSEAGTYRVLASTNAIDRQGDVVDQNGWELDNFLKNPVILWAHNYDELPVGKAISIGKSANGLEMEFEFAPMEANPKAQQVKNLFDLGYLNAVSVGFIPKERNGNIIIRSELLEVSIVPVPANQEALRLAMSKGLDISALEKDIAKGEVTDILNEQEMMEQKYENMDQVWDIISALCQAYCSQDVAVEDFSKLLLESIGLLTQVANGEEVTTPDADEEPMMDAYVGKRFGITEKEGRVLSKKNLELITNCIATMQSGVAALDELAKASSSDTGGSKSTDEIVEIKTEEDVVVLSAKDAMTLIRQNVRATDRAQEVTLGIINSFLEKKK